MEEFRRRKDLKKYYELMKNQRKDDAYSKGKPSGILDLDDESITKETQEVMSGPERFFMPEHGETFNPRKFTLIFMDSDSVTNVTALNRVNHRRVLLFIGNGDGVISYAMGKSDDYEKAFEHAFRKLRANMIILNLD